MLHSSVVSSSGVVTGGGEGGVEGEGSGLRGVLAAVWVPAGSAGNAAANINVH